MPQHVLFVKDHWARAGLLAIAAAVLVFVTACTPGVTGSSASPSASATPVASATPASASATPSPPATATAGDCSDDGIVPGRLGCLDANLPVTGNPGEAAVTWDGDHCSPGDGRFVFTAAPDRVGLGGADGGEIGRIDVYDPTLTTAEGIHVGSTRDEVVSAYPSTPVVTSFSGTGLVVIAGPEGFITIELANGWGSEPWTVANIRIYAADQDPNVPVYGTEDFAGACPLGV
ncbi:hypothetical protein [Demequina sp.]|uniref:hypothetical protein n=1 Tax=Demequina sp. TaxID=2050685 RepID=UPI0025BAAC1E|nr:hypothetical protein [Demequina sp.]